MQHLQCNKYVGSVESLVGVVENWQVFCSLNFLLDIAVLKREF